MLSIQASHVIKYFYLLFANSASCVENETNFTTSYNLDLAKYALVSFRF